MKYISLLFLTLLTFTGNPENIDNKSFIIIQLFTSQGCSSCPPADRLVERVKEEYKNQNVFVLSYHVDYWDRLGWKDPFSQRKFTEIQYEYATQFRERSVYTPQIVVNGKEHFVGSDEFRLKRKIKSYLKDENSANSVELSITKNEKGDLVVNYKVLGDVNDKKLHLAFALNKSVTEIKKGENSNRTLTNTNIVLDEVSLDLENNSSGSITLSKDTFASQKEMKIIAFVQDASLKISGASKLDLH